MPGPSRKGGGRRGPDNKVRNLLQRVCARVRNVWRLPLEFRRPRSSGYPDRQQRRHRGYSPGGLGARGVSRMPWLLFAAGAQRTERIPLGRSTARRAPAQTIADRIMVAGTHERWVQWLDAHLRPCGPLKPRDRISRSRELHLTAWAWIERGLTDIGETGSDHG